jgi:hypothetical protein
VIGATILVEVHLVPPDGYQLAVQAQDGEGEPLDVQTTVAYLLSATEDLIRTATDGELDVVAAALAWVEAEEAPDGTATARPRSAVRPLDRRPPRPRPRRRGA